MTSHLAVVLTNGSLDDGNGNQSQTRSGAVLQILKDSVDIALSCPQLNTQSSTLKKTSSSIGVQSDDGKATEVGGTSLRGLQDVGKPSRLNLPITVRTGRPVLCNQPIRIKVVIPGLCKRPITNSATSSTKAVVPPDGPVCPLGPVAESSGPGPDQRMEIDPNEISAERNQTTTTFTTTTEIQTQDAERAGRGDGARNSAEDGGDAGTPLPSTPESFNTQRDGRTREDMEEEEEEEEEEEGDSKNQVSSQHSLSLAIAERSGTVNAVETRAVEEEEEEGRRGEQVEVLDLSLPKKTDGGVREWRGGCFLGDARCESSLIMEVDEIEGEGDRDVVEEDDGEDEEDEEDTGPGEGNALPSPSFFSTSIFTSLSSIDSESCLLIDDQGIPYTLTADGHKVPQMDSSQRDPPLSGQGMVRSDAVGVGERRSPAASGVKRAGPSSGNTLNTHTERSGLLCGAAETGRSKTTGLSNGTEVSKSLGQLKTTEPQKVPEGAVKVSVSKPCVSAVPPQSIQILTNPSSNTPFLLLSSTPQLSSSSLALSLPLSLPQNSPGTSTPMILLLSSIPSSSGQSFSTSTPIAVINSSTGQLSQITASSPSISLPLMSAQVTPAGSALSGSALPGSALSGSSSSHPVIRLTPNNPPLILSRAGETSSLPSAFPSPSLLSSSSTKLPTVVVSGNAGVKMPCPAPQVKSGLSDDPDPVDPDDSPSAEETQSHDVPPPPPAPPLTSQPTSELSIQPSPGESDQSPGSDSELASGDLTSDSFPLNDHPYFSSGSTAACGSPPLAPIVPAGQPGELEPLSPPSSPSSPSSLGPRRVLFCQLCPRVFYYLSDLERHSITHSQIKPHVCQQCGKAFKRSSHLQRHKHIHTGQRNFVCSICAKRFRESGELQRHQRVHTGEKPYQCQLCHTRFAERNTLRRHTRRKHPYHQVAMEMLSERRGGGGGGGVGGGDEEESAEWYSSTVSNFGNSDSETDT